MNYSQKIILVVISCLFLQLLNAHTQDLQKVDSLELSLKLAENANDKVDILLKLSNEFNNNDPTKALNYAQKACSISEEIDYENGRLNSLINMARNYWSITDYKTAMEFAVKAKELAEELSADRELALSLYIIGIIYFELDDYNKSAEYFFECLKINEQINDKEGIGRTFSSIGSLNFKQKNYDKALEYFFKSLNIAKEINDRFGIARGLNNIAAVYGDMADYSKACQYIEEALEINKKLMNRKSEGINYINLGDINLRLKNYNVAFKYLQQALLTYKNLKHPLFIARCQISLGNYYLEINNIEQSLEYAKTAFEEGKKHGFKTVVHNSAELLSKIYLSKNDTLNAFKYDIIKYRMKDSLIIEKSNTELARLELKYEFNKKEQEKKIEQQRKDFIILLIIISLISGLIVIVLIFARQRIKAKNVSLEKQKIEVELNSRNKEFTTNVMYMMKKNEMLSVISEKLIQIENDAVKDETKTALKRIAIELQKSKDKDIWEEFELRFNQVHNDFYEKLIQKFPELTSNDLRLCAFLKLNMSSKEISEITGQQVTTLEHARSRVRKKLGISKTQIDLVTFLSQI